VVCWIVDGGVEERERVCLRESVCVGPWCDVSVVAKYPPRRVRPATPALPLAQCMRMGGDDSQAR
jgi:hypothetical protein